MIDFALVGAEGSKQFVADPYGSTTNCTKPPQILWSQGGALGSMGHVAEKRQWAKNLNGKDGGGKGLG